MRKGLVVLPAASLERHSGGYLLPGQCHDMFAHLTLQCQASHPTWTQVPYRIHSSMELAAPWGLHERENEINVKIFLIHKIYKYMNYLYKYYHHNAVCMLN